MPPVFTVFTPTYNRGHVLHRVYESLLHQTFRSFEWLIIDDGSCDNTEAVVEEWVKDPKTFFPIRYIKQANGHKKTAHNHAVREASGELFLPLDSDDRCVPNALEQLYFHWTAIPAENRHAYSGVTGLCVDQHGVEIGDRFPVEQWLDSNPLDIRYRYRINGEQWGFTRTDILKNYLFPEDIPGHVPENIVWFSIARSYKSRFINEILRIYYKEDVNDNIMNGSNFSSISPGLLYWKCQILSDDLSYFRYNFFYFLAEGARLTRFYLHCPDFQKRAYWPKGFWGKAIVVVMAPVGFIWWGWDVIRKKIER